MKNKKVKSKSDAAKSSKPTRRMDEKKLIQEHKKLISDLSAVKKEYGKKDHVKERLSDQLRDQKKELKEYSKDYKSKVGQKMKKQSVIERRPDGGQTIYPGNEPLKKLKEKWAMIKSNLENSKSIMSFVDDEDLEKPDEQEVLGEMEQKQMMAQAAAPQMEPGMEEEMPEEGMEEDAPSEEMPEEGAEEEAAPEEMSEEESMEEEAAPEEMSEEESEEPVEEGMEEGMSEEEGMEEEMPEEEMEESPEEMPEEEGMEQEVPEEQLDPMSYYEMKMKQAGLISPWDQPDLKYDHSVGQPEQATQEDHPVDVSGGPETGHNLVDVMDPKKMRAKMIMDEHNIRMEYLKRELDLMLKLKEEQMRGQMLGAAAPQMPPVK
jgi:hypothetical protein